jgi:GGDEF domain-containing protein
VKRTQLYIEDDVIKMLRRVSKEQAVSISELVRAAVRKAYSLEKPGDADLILKEAAGIWKDRKDIPPAERYVRQMRKDTRKERLSRKS